MRTSVSVIICTRNRPESCQLTLGALANVAVPSDMNAELILVNNGLKDRTEGVAAVKTSANFKVRYAQEPIRGLSQARNVGVRLAKGEILLFIDDDVRPTTNWLRDMCTPILEGRADAVAGGVQLAPHLQRQWMLPFHRELLASTERFQANAPREMFGANMAISRAVFARIAGFDTEIGAGRLGFCEDSLFSRQLGVAGFRLASALDAKVEHHFDPTRLLRSMYLQRAIGQGRSLAYIRHHWEHAAISYSVLRRWKKALILLLHRSLTPCDPSGEGISEWEFDTVVKYSLYRHFRIESRRPRLYERFGLVKTTTSHACKFK